MAGPGEMDFDKVPDAAFEKLGTTREEMIERQRASAEREKRTPRAGDTAPDFEIERLSAEGQRTGEMFQLSAQRGRPVALVFGSYT